MKRFFLLLVILNFTFVFSQENKIIPNEIAPPHLDNVKKPNDNYTPRQVEKMVILKECKSVDENDKTELQLCLAEELRNKIYERFSEFDETADRIQLTENTIKIQLLLSKEGEIRDVKTFNFGSKELSTFTAETLESLKSEIQFEPAQINGEKVNLVFQLPVKYMRNRE